MRIKRFNELNNSKGINEVKRTELFGIHRAPSYVYSRGEQDFYDYYTRKKFRGESKYQLNTKLFKIAESDDDMNDKVISQMVLQVERESIAADEWIVSQLEELQEEVNLLKEQLGIQTDVQNQVQNEIDEIPNNIQDDSQNDIDN